MQVVHPVPRYPLEYFMRLRRHPPEFFETMARIHGDLVSWSIGGNQIFLISHPDLIHEVLTLPHPFVTKGRALERSKRLLGEGLLNSHGEFHLSQRRMMQPAFHRQRIARYADAMVEETLRMSDTWEDKGWVDIHRAMMDLALSIVCRTLLGGAVVSDMERIRSAIDNVLSLFGVVPVPWQNVIDRLPVGPAVRFRNAKAVLDEVIYRMIAEHRKSGTDRGDVLSILLSAQDEGRRMTDLQVRDEAITIFLAGHETTANALTWAWYLIAQMPEVERALLQEVDEVLGDRPATFEDVSRLVYTRQVLSESMRLYPPAWTIARRALQEVRLGDVTIPQDGIMITSQWVVHHDARWWPDPYRFDTNRWTPQAEATRPRMAYFPFGAGSRICIGEQFAWMEGILILATVAQRWRFRRIGTAPVGTLARITLRPRRPVLMRLHARTRRPTLVPA